MVATQFDKLDRSCRFLIRPNRSLPWRDVVRFYLGMLIVSFGISIAFALKGAWLVLPFAGLEMLLLGVALYLVARRGCCWQSIAIRGDSIDVVDHKMDSDCQQTFQRAWARVELRPAAIQGYPSRLLICSHGRCMELGGYLTENEKRQLAQELRRAVRE